MKNLSLVFFLLISHVTLSQTLIWEQQNIFPGSARSEAVSFVIGDTAYVGTGRNETNFFQDFYKYDIATNSWTQIANLPGDARYGAVAFSIGNKGYVGTGTDGTNEFGDFYEYDPETGSWTAIADFMGSARHFAAAFSLSGMGYVGTGRDDSDETSDFYRYDPDTDTWSSVASLGTDNLRQEAAGFTIGTKGYISSGFVVTNDFATIVYSDVHEYDDETDTWTNKVSADVNLSNKQGSASLVLDGKAYLIGGSSTNSTIVYDPSNDSVTEIYNFGPSTEDDRNDPIAFTLNGNGFAGFGVTSPEIFVNEYRRDVWKLVSIEQPEAPSNSFITSLQKTSARVSWTNNATGEDGFFVYLSEGNNENFQIIDTITFTSHEFTELTEGTRYYARIAAYRDTLTSEFHATDFRTRSDLPFEPDSLAIEPSSFRPGFLLTWNDNSFNEQGFIIERATNAEGPFVTIDSVSSSRREFIDDDTVLLLNTSYYYRVAAYNEFGNSAMTAVVSENTATLVPEAPLIEIGSLTDASGDNFTLQIDRPEIEKRVSFYTTQKAPENDEFSGTDSTTFFNSIFGIGELETQRFRYIVYNKFGSDTSNVIVASAGLANPKTVRVGFSSENVLTLEFNSGSRAHIGTRVERSENGSDFAVIADYKRADYFVNNSFRTLFFDSTVQASNRYSYRLQNYNEALVSNYSVADSAIAKKTGVWREVRKNGTSEAVDSLDAFVIRRQFYTNGKVYLLSLTLGNFISYEVSTATFTTLPDFPNSSPAEGHVAGLKDGVIYVFGGLDTNNNSITESWAYNISDGNWNRLADPPDSINFNQHDPIFATDGNIYMSGNDDSFDFAVIKYNIANDNFEAFGSPSGRFFSPRFSYALGDSITFLNSSVQFVDGVIIPDPSQSFNINSLAFNIFQKQRSLLNSARSNEFVRYRDLNYWIDASSKRAWTYDNLSDFNLTYAGPVMFPPFSSFSTTDDNVNGIAFTESDTLYYGFGRFERSSRSFRGLYFLDDKNLSRPIHFRADSITDTSAILRWFNPEQNVDGFILEDYDPVLDEFVVIDSLEAEMRSYRLTSLEQNNYYTFYIRSYQGDRVSEQNVHTFRTIQVYPNRVRNLSSEVLSDTSIKLDWEVNNDVPFDEILVTDINSDLLIELTHEDTTVTITDLIEGISYGFEVMTRNEFGSASEFISQKTLLSAPEITRIGVINDRYVVNWDDNSEFETNYVVQRKLPDDEYFTSLDTLGQAQVYVDQGSVIDDVEHFYRVQALEFTQRFLEEGDTLILTNHSVFSEEASSIADLLILNASKIGDADIQVYPNPAVNEYPLIVT